MIRTILAALVILGAGLAPVAIATPAWALAEPTETLNLTTPDGRSLAISVWTAPEERGVIVFSHGFGGEPRAYERIFQYWQGEGFTVAAPLHIDSRRHASQGRVDGQTAFMTRIADLAVTRGAVKAAHPGRPIAVAGHSFGSLMSMIEAGAVTAAGPQGDPDVKAVIAFSSAGAVRGLVTADSYRSLTAPIFMVTGDQDLVEGFVTDWKDHRGPFDGGAPENSLLAIVAGGNHNLVATAEGDLFAFLAETTTDFLKAEVLDEAEAQARLTALVAPPTVSVERR